LPDNPWLLVGETVVPRNNTMAARKAGTRMALETRDTT
jgi:hypothetical protein